jgi:hypothetical protein
MVASVQRIPYADPKRVDKLPSEAKGILEFAKDRVPKSVYKVMENLFVDVSSYDGSSNPLRSEKMLYGGELTINSVYGKIISDLGVYNPDVIPYEIYEKMSHDPTLALGLSVIKNTPAGLNWRIECSSEKQRVFVTSVVKNIYRNTILNLADAVRIGMSLGEKVWDYRNIKIYSRSSKGVKQKVFDDDYWILDNIKFVHPRSIRIKLDNKGNLAGVIQKVGGKIIKVKKSKLAVYSHNVEFGNFYGTARLKNSYPAWYWGTVLNQFALKYMERRAIPLTEIKAPRGSSTDENGKKVDNMTHALKVGQAAMSNSIVVLPFEQTKDGKEMWNYRHVPDEQRGDMFIAILNYMDSRKLRGLFIPDKMGLASDGSPHSSTGSVAGDALDVFIMTEQSLINDFEYLFDTQIIPQIQQYNFDAEEIEEATLKIEKLDYNKKLLLKDVLMRMIMLTAGTIRDGKVPRFLPSIKKLADILDLPMDTFEDVFEEISQPDTRSTPVDNTSVPVVKVGKKNVQKDLSPTIDKKQAIDKNNANRATQRKERSSRDRSVREKRR